MKKVPGVKEDQPPAFNHFRKSSKGALTSPAETSTEDYSTADELPRVARSSRTVAMRRLSQHSRNQIGMYFNAVQFIWFLREDF